MRVRHELPERAPERVQVLGIGFFDGVHRGHRAILRALGRLRRPGETVAALTFREHPAAYLRPGSEPPLITTLEERIALLAEAGVDELYVLAFDARIAALDASAFLREVLHDRLRIRALAIGENFRFGAGRAGDAQLAAAVLGPLGVTVSAIPPLLDGGERVSSTRVRAALMRGDLETADALLGASYLLRGRVTFGAGRGHELGFPTANLAFAPEKLLPMDGVYNAVARFEGRDYASLVSIGDNPTFGEGPKTVEAWLRDFDATIYGRELGLRGFRFIRAQQRFENREALLDAMRSDAAHVAYPTFA